MEVISYIMLIVLSFYAYSAGVALKAGKSFEPKPKIIDLFLILVIWTAAVYSRLVLDLNRWFLILVWITAGLILGALVTRQDRLPDGWKSPNEAGSKKASTNPVKKLWQFWGGFSKRIESFETRVVLSLFFFVFVGPLALAVKTFSDPLGIRRQNSKSYWLPEEKTEAGLEQFRKQF